MLSWKLEKELAERWYIFFCSDTRTCTCYLHVLAEDDVNSLSLLSTAINLIDTLALQNTVCYTMYACIYTANTTKYYVIYTASTHYLFLCELDTGEEVDSLLVAKVDIVSKEKHKQQFANIFLFLVSF